MGKKKLKIYYDDENINSKLDKDLTNLLKKYGYKFEGSGYDLRDKKRDLAFYK